MTEYPGDFLPPLYLLSSLPHLHERVIRDPSKPSAVRVLGRSLFMVAAGWLVAIGWLWVSALQRSGGTAHLFALSTLATAAGPAAALALAGYLFGRFLGRAPYRELNWREWRHAFWWSAVPNSLLLSTAWIIVG